MELYFLGKIPEGLEFFSTRYSLAEFDEWDLTKLNKLGVEKAWYWYATAPYEGAGQLLMLKDEVYYLHDCGHCSCYVATDRIILEGGFDSLDQLEGHCTEELLKEVKPLIDMARSGGYQ